MSERVRAWRFYLDDMIDFAERVLAYTQGFDQGTFETSGITWVCRTWCGKSHHAALSPDGLKGLAGSSSWPFSR